MVFFIARSPPRVTEVVAGVAVVSAAPDSTIRRSDGRRVGGGHAPPLPDAASGAGRSGARPRRAKSERNVRRALSRRRSMVRGVTPRRPAMSAFLRPAK
jgi:hypothetical protein